MYVDTQYIFVFPKPSGCQVFIVFLSSSATEQETLSEMNSRIQISLATCKLH